VPAKLDSNKRYILVGENGVAYRSGGRVIQLFGHVPHGHKHGSEEGICYVELPPQLGQFRDDAIVMGLSRWVNAMFEEMPSLRHVGQLETNQIRNLVR
jgi:hypothetical protein